MANNYTQTSFAIPLTESQILWAMSLLEHLRSAEDGQGPNTDSYEEQIRRIDPENFWLGDIEAENQGDHLWVWCADYFNPEFTALWLMEIIHHFGLDDAVWSFTWAETSSKPRLDEFGGGACIVTKEGSEFISVHGWVREKTKRKEQADA